MMGLTTKQHRALTYFRAVAEEGGPSPTYEEIARALGLKSKSGSYRIVESLCQRGFLERIPFKSQSVRLHPSPPAYEPPAQPLQAKHPPPDQSQSVATQRRRTYAVELEGDLHRRLRTLSRKSEMPPEQIIAAAVRWFVMEPNSAAEALENDKSRPAGC